MINPLKFLVFKPVVTINCLGIIMWCLFFNTLKAQELDYTVWDNLLKQHVSHTGVVNYKSFYTDKDKLHQFTNYLATNTPKKSWTENDKKAYLINLYNANTIQIILDNYPVNSIKDISGSLSSVFRKKVVHFNEELISLDHIEKKILLPMGDARVHFAINCASISCPQLANYAFKPHELDKQLHKVTSAFINSENVTIKNNKLYLSKIFKWYKNDFEEYAGSVINFINTYSKKSIDTNLSIDYNTYNWDINGIN